MKITALLALLLAPMAVASEHEWQDCFQTCSGISEPGILGDLSKLQKTVNDGKGWEKDVAQEQAALRKLTDVTCPAYLANPNGDTSLAAFRAEFSRVTTNVLQSKQSADTIRAYLDLRSAPAETFFAQFGISFGTTRCGMAFGKAKATMQAQETAVEKQFQTLQSRCPAIASADTVKVLKGIKSPAPGGTSAPAAGEPGSARQRESKVTGSDDEKAP